MRSHQETHPKTTAREEPTKRVISMNEERQSTILVVEDDQDIREALMSVLEDEGYTVLGAANGLDGLEVLARISRPCMILLDLMMPVMSGAEFLSQMRRDDILAPVPVV